MGVMSGGSTMQHICAGRLPVSACGSRCRRRSVCASNSRLPLQEPRAARRERRRGQAVGNGSNSSASRGETVRLYEGGEPRALTIVARRMQ